MSPPVRSQDVEIPEPCHADWDAMRPEERGRFCFECQTKVHDLSAMTEAEAERFLEQSACQDVCVSYRHAPDGTIVFRPAPAETPLVPLVPLARLRRRPTPTPSSIRAAVAAAGMAAALAACAPHGQEPQVREEEEISFQAPAAVIPHGPAQEATPVPPPPPVAEDEPCDSVRPSESIGVDAEPAVRGKLHRTAGKPVMRKTGTRARIDPFDE